MPFGVNPAADSYAFRLIVVIFHLWRWSRSLNKGGTIGQCPLLEWNNVTGDCRLSISFRSHQALRSSKCDCGMFVWPQGKINTLLFGCVLCQRQSVLEERKWKEPWSRALIKQLFLFMKCFQTTKTKTTLFIYFFNSTQVWPQTKSKYSGRVKPTSVWIGEKKKIVSCCSPRTCEWAGNCSNALTNLTSSSFTCFIHQSSFLMSSVLHLWPPQTFTYSVFFSYNIYFSRRVFSFLCGVTSAWF